MNEDSIYDVAIVGGGLAGLSLVVQLAQAGYKTLVLEKDEYPKHKVCGEYISNESRPFLQRIGVDIDSMQLPYIDKLLITDVKGYKLNARLPQGGFGISRYKLDDELAKLATERGAQLEVKTRAEQVTNENGVYSITAKGKIYLAKMVCGSWGKRSNIDVKWERPFITSEKRKLNNYIGIKYHLKYPVDSRQIALHNFTDGYCGISKIEDDTCCLCYLTTAKNLQQNGGDIKAMEQSVLMKNPMLKSIFNEGEFLYRAPLAISQISFQQKEQVMEHVLMLGDAAGLITPLCGNGMSMAFHSGKIAFEVIDSFLKGKLSRNRMEKNYAQKWQEQFGTRLKWGRVLQANFGRNATTSIFLKTMNALPFLKKPLINATSGAPF